MTLSPGLFDDKYPDKSENLLILTSTVKNLLNFDQNSISDLIQKEEVKLNDPKISDKER